MKRLLVTLCGILFFTSCSTLDNEVLALDLNTKEFYLESNLPKILDLEKKDVNEFKKTMYFDKDGKLSSWNFSLLEKAYNDQEEFASVLLYLLDELGESLEEMIVVDGIIYILQESNEMNKSRMGLIEDEVEEDVDGGGKNTIRVTFKGFKKSKNSIRCNVVDKMSTCYEYWKR